jgi:DNA-directed RNA polymerase specialized sigma subunit
MPRTVVEIPQEVKEQMIRDNRRMPYQQVAKLYGYGRNKTYEVVRGTCARKCGSKKITDREKKALVEDYLNGLSPKKLASKYNITYAYVFRILKQNNVELRGQFSKSAEIKRDLKEGELTQSAIAKKYGLSRQRISVIKKEMEGADNEQREN